MHPEADMSFYVKVGVVPFQSLAADRFAGEKFSTEFTTALLASGKFGVVEQGIFVHALLQVTGKRTTPDGLTADQLKKIADVTGVQGVFEGTVTHYQMQLSGGDYFPVVAAEVRLVDTETGTIVWKATVSDRGGPKTPIIGVGEIHTFGELSQKLSKQLVSKIE
jgi:curli biogenesis system outer membrane secretion channel CsgG